MKFIISYTTGMYEDHTDFILPVEAESENALRASLDAEIKYKRELQKQVMAAHEALPSRSFSNREEVGVWLEHPLVQRHAELTQQYYGSVKVCDRYFPGLDEIEIEEMEIVTMEAWLESYDIADAQEDARRHGKVDA